MKVRGIHYHIEDSLSDGEPLILIHGFTGSSENWQHILPFLNDYRVIRIDMIGHGMTDKPNEPSRYKVEEIVEDLREIVIQLKLEKVNILGYSMGGRIALSFAVLYPNYVKKLILESSSPGLRTMEERLIRVRADENLANEIISNGIDSFVRKWEQIPLFSSQRRLPEAQQQWLREQRQKNSSIGLANSLIGTGTGAQPSWWNMLQKVEVPTQLICGQLDKKFCAIAKEMNKLLPISNLKEINNTGHAIHVEQPRIFGKIVSEFLKNEQH